MCGVGARVASGQNRCVGGRISSTCRPTSPIGIDSSCNGVDEDCDGRTDGFRACSIVVSQCAARGLRACQEGSVIEDCTPGTAPNDASCNGLDDDCDGSNDEDAERSRRPAVKACVGGCVAV